MWHLRDLSIYDKIAQLQSEVNRLLNRIPPFFVLIFCNLIWSAHPLMGKLMLAHATPFQVAWLRYTSAFLMLVLLLKKQAILPLKSLNKTEWSSLLGLGLLTFGLAPLLQVSGLAKAQAVDNAILIAVEPILSVAIAAVILRERIGLRQGLIFLGAGFGFYLLADLDSNFKNLSVRGLGNIFLLLSLLGEAFHSALSAKLVQRFSPAMATASALGVGVVFLTLMLEIQGPGLLSLIGLGQRVSASGDSISFLLALIWLGPLGTALGYWLWVTVLSRLPVSGMVLSLLVQPLVGVLASALFLDEFLSYSQMIGAALLLLSLVIQARLRSKARS